MLSSFMISDNPMIALRGVRSSCAMLARNLVFCEIGCLCCQHRFLGTLGSSVSLLLRGE
jgi:hypothetical protein